MQTYRNIHFTKRDYECTNVVACKATYHPGENWEVADNSILNGLMLLNAERYTENGQPVELERYGYL